MIEKIHSLCNNLVRLLFVATMQSKHDCREQRVSLYTKQLAPITRTWLEAERNNFLQVAGTIEKNKLFVFRSSTSIPI